MLLKNVNAEAEAKYQTELAAYNEAKAKYDVEKAAYDKNLELYNAKKTAYEADLETKQAIENTMQMLKLSTKQPWLSTMSKKLNMT